MNGPLEIREPDFQLTAFGTILHFRRISKLLLEKCLLTGWRLDRPDRDPHATLEWNAGADGSGMFHLLVKGQIATNTPADCETLSGSLDQILHLAIAEFSPKAVFLHAGVTVWNGAAILIPGRSHSGKSTLTRSLIDAGAVYYSDEFAPVLPDGSVIPYPKPLSLRPYCSNAGTSEPPAKTDPADLGWKRDLPPVPVGMVAAVVYDPGNPDARPKAISKAEAATFLLNNTIPMLKAPCRSLAAASKVARNALCLGGARPDASGFARELVHTLSLGKV